MDCVGPILDIGIRLWDCAAKRVRYIRNLEKNNTKLSNAMEELKSLRDDVKRRVELSESQDLQSTKQVSDWLKSVGALELEVDQILRKGSEEIRGECLVCRPKDPRSAYKLSKKTVKSLAAVEKLLAKGKFEAVAIKKPRNPADELPEERTVGLDSMMNEIWKCVRRNDVGIIGLFGMGGVGKTTLLRRINNTFFGSSGDYDAVIWVVVSKEASTGKIQNAIRDRLQIPNDNWNGKNEDDRAMEIYKALNGKKFVLLVDDLWKRLDLLKLGVPLPGIHNGSKVIFTTRSEEVCGQMEADRCVRVKCLGRDEALELFLSKLGKETLKLHPNILNLAKDVAEECKGLPLALITIGRSMASRKTIEDWERAVQLLKRYPASFTGVVDYVYHLLEFSYDSLPSDTIKSCFLYCSLFPKDYNIRKSELVDLWIGEGLLDELEDIRDARRHGEEIIGTLKLACLLEPGESEESVKIHDVIRDMTLWLACEHGEKKNKFLVKETVRPRYNFAKAKDVSEKISLWGREIRDLSGVLFGPSLFTLLVTGTLIKTFPSESFESLLGLVVLDLSGNERLAQLPEGIGGLKSLQSLNLSRTALRALPTEMKNLKKLRSLLLNDTYDLLDVPSQVISGLSSLRTFSRLLSPVRMHFYPDYDETALLDELEHLEFIDDLCITIIYSPSLQKVLTSKKFQPCIRKLTVLCYLTPFEMSISCLTRTTHLEGLEIWNANPLRIFADKQRFRDTSSFRALRVLVVVQCDMSDMNWLAHVPYLGTLRIIDCPSISTVLTGDSEPTTVLFSCLVTLDLQGLPRLESVVKSHQGGSAYPLLKKVTVMNCPRLTKLPFDDSNERVKEISGAREWWDKLVWNDETVKSFFAPKFVPLLDTSHTTSCESCEDLAPALSLPR